MLQVPPNAGPGGQTLIRLLAHLTEAQAPESAPSLSGQLSQWLGWTDAIALSSALNGNPPAVPTAGARAAVSDEAGDSARVRAMLADAIRDDRASARGRRSPVRPLPQEALDASADFAIYRQRYQTLQQRMETAIGDLRSRLRAALARRPGQGRLAMLDTVMERVMGAREQALLANVPTLLEAHYQRLRRAEESALAQAASVNTANTDNTADAAGTAHTTERPEPAGVAATVTPGAWRRVFRRDMEDLLLAELDLRFQPVEGLVAALGANRSGS
ncbi:DUF3348 family protein [Cupriavidus gilardii]|uniref:DUF3348 domain-containing protein n=1 Tax=Cupriavidus gilardii TaxID=82541 RepID=UPI001572C028|nr:DUF3348 domain-containing protein [Cupriavidus gilardii]MCG5262102.1 DUF3348 domain-containing protein [Cupriavidus gilardii]MDF9430712.1 DUF3348 family protein [Cupriavidus gilardii]NSX04687.1 DUF3348 domain-containing protein [Cupriavidus gilardii]